jgi:hypothetical protein
MFVAKGNRSLLLDYIGAGTSFSGNESNLPADPPSGNSFYLIWETQLELKNRALPAFIVLPDGQARDLLAWASTFIGTIKPFTAFIRVIEWSVAQTLFEHFAPTDISRFQNSLVGLIIGEGLARNNLGNPSDLTISKCRSTTSYTLGRAFSAGLITSGLDSIMKRYYKILKQEENVLQSIDIEELYLIWVLLKRLANADSSKTNKSWSKLVQLSRFGVKESVLDYYMDYILETCREIETSGDISEPIWNRLSNNSNLYFEMKEEMQSTRERRVLFFEKAISSQAIQAIEIPLAKNFIAAFLTYKINPGSMSHCSLLDGITKKHFPTALIWYGFISGLSTKSDIISAFDCLGRLIIRDITYRSELFDQPTCHVSADEIEVVSSGENQLSYYKKYVEKELKIEIFPHVNMYVPVRDATDNRVINSGYDQKLLSELGDNLKRAFELFTTLKSGGDRSYRDKATYQSGTTKRDYPYNQDERRVGPSGNSKAKTSKSSYGKKKVIEKEQPSFFPGGDNENNKTKS